jgi:hypothetical protein
MIDPHDLFTKPMISEARKLCFPMRNDRVNVIERDVILPNMDHINKVTGQENDSRYMAYLLNYLIDSGKL